MPYKLIYWAIPFRGNFVRLLLEIANISYEDISDFDSVIEWKNQPLKNQQLPSMAPPHLVDLATGKSYGQLPVILMHLAEVAELLPEGDDEQKLCMKLILDSNDILLEITRFHGMTMWNRKDWTVFREKRLPRWMSIFEEIKIKFGNQDGPYFFGEKLTLSDVVVYALWGTMVTRLEPLKLDLEENAPNIAQLVNTVANTPAVKQFEERQQKTFGQFYCGGDIEKSLKEMLVADQKQRE